MPNSAKPLTTPQYQALLRGLPIYCASTVVTIDGQAYTASSLVALIESILASEAAIPIAKSSWLEAVAVAAKLQATSGQTVKDARGVLALMFRNDPGTLAELGMDPPKPRAKLSVKARLAATEKLRATRKARGTKSKKQRSKIKGDVTGVTIEPVTSKND